MNSNEISNVRSVLPTSSQVPIVRDKQGYVRPMNFSQAITRSKQTMLDIQKRGKSSQLIGWTTGRLIDLFTYLGVYDIVTDYQIQMLAQRICARFYYWTTAELDYAFVEFENGEYGKLFQSKQNGEVKTINPQDIMAALLKYEKELLAERGRVEDEQRRRAEAEQARKDAQKPHGLDGWKAYCESKGLDPSTHKIATVKLHSVNEELYDTPEKRAAAERKFEPLRKKQN